MKPRRTRTGAGRMLAGTVAAFALTLGAAATSPAQAAATSGEAARPAAQQAAKPCSYSTARPKLQLGDTGAAVKQAQCYLLHTLIIDDMIKVTGTFDRKTELRVGQFQQRCTGLASTGAVNKATWRAMERLVGDGRTC